MSRVRGLFVGGVVATLALILTGCYFPVRFDAEIELTTNGFYDIRFDGYVADADLYQGLADGKILPPQESEMVSNIRRDLTREKAAKAVQYRGQGIFRLNWEKSGDLIRYKAVTFLRRNSSFFILSYNREKSVIVLQTMKIGDKEIERLRNAGLGPEGEIRFTTAAEVVEHNAHKVSNAKTGGGKTYVWRIKSAADLGSDPADKSRSLAPYLVVAM
jgi:hypothetical protein